MKCIIKLTILYGRTEATIKLGKEKNVIEEVNSFIDYSSGGITSTAFIRAKEKLFTELREMIRTQEVKEIKIKGKFTEDKELHTFEIEVIKY